MAKERQRKKLHVDFFDEFMECTLLSLVLWRGRHAVQYKNNQFLKFTQKNFIFAQNLEKFARKQNMPKFSKNLPNFKKLPNTCRPATVLGLKVQSTLEVNVLLNLFWSLIRSNTNLQTLNMNDRSTYWEVITPQASSKNKLYTTCGESCAAIFH